MSDDLHVVRVVLDTNVVLRGLTNPDSPSGQLLDACEARRGICLLSKPLIDEYRRVLKDASVEHPFLSVRDIELAIHRLRYFGDYLQRVEAKFPFPRDPTDEKVIALAIDAHRQL